MTGRLTLGLLLCPGTEEPMNLYNTPIMPGPFDDSAKARQTRMGLLQSDGAPDQEAVAVLSRVYAGLMFDDLCESSPDMERVYAICGRFAELQKQGDAKKTLLFICLQYDGMLRALPEPIWWIVGNPALVEPFCEGFVRRLCEFKTESEVM